ncbi:MAG: vanadium-dependent haloperoxidase [Myxococcales bacterium FL481]|nr:MAG: vanadium-dependent haloperoxidase [Myxococcales bacterium FL481]
MAVASGLLSGTLASRSARADDFAVSDPDTALDGELRKEEALVLKRSSARHRRNDTDALGPQLDNDDESRYAGDRYYASFSKCLQHNAFGEVNRSGFESLQLAMRTGAAADFAAITLAGGADRTLANPQGAFKFEPFALDSHATRIAPSHTFRSAEIAGEMGEVYWQALMRDVPFSQYGSSPLAADAVLDLNGFGAPPAPANGPVSTANLFRGETPGDLVGPYISQFLWQDFDFGPIAVTQRYETPVANVDFMLTESAWRTIQRGAAPNQSLTFEASDRYIFNNRSLGEFVHRDVSFQAYLHAALALLGYGSNALDPGNPYRSAITTQGAFVSHGAPFLLDMVTKAANLALTGAWFQKWRVHRFLRPEVFAGRIHFHIAGSKTYELHSDILNSNAVADVFSRNGTYFLPQAYPEGSPTHPSYPAGHACIAGACVTVLKAFFNESFVIPNPVEANSDGTALLTYSGSALTVGDELNKLASNMSLGRDAAGVHYRQDGIQGLLSGEQQALALLREQSRTMNEIDFDGFSLTTFGGANVKILDGELLFP